jgi:antitoxin ParD1/3/4
MNVSLTPELERLVAERVESGRYASASEVIREALRFLEERDRLTTLRRDIDAGIDALDRGESRPFDKAAIARIKRAGRERLSREPTPRSKAR